MYHIFLGISKRLDHTSHWFWLWCASFMRDADLTKCCLRRLTWSLHRIQAYVGRCRSDLTDEVVEEGHLLRDEERPKEGLSSMTAG